MYVSATKFERTEVIATRRDVDFVVAVPSSNVAADGAAGLISDGPVDLRETHFNYIRQCLFRSNENSPNT